MNICRLRYIDEQPYRRALAAALLGIPKFALERRLILRALRTNSDATMARLASS